jgi:hypothetical protein
MARRRLWRNSSLLGLVVPRGASQDEARPVHGRSRSEMMAQAMHTEGAGFGVIGGVPAR